MSEAIAQPEFSDRDAQKIAEAVAEQCLGQPAEHVAPLGGGLTNFAFEVGHAEGDFVVRLSPDPAKLNDYRKEEWAHRRAREEGVPASEILKVGLSPEGVPYSIAHQAAGQDARSHSNTLDIVREMGHLTALINAIATQGCGDVFDWEDAETGHVQSWGDFFTNDFDAGRRVAFLREHGLLAERQASALASIVEEMSGFDAAPALAHGDMRLKNVLVNEQGAITAVIDWEECTSSIPPYWDLSIALHDLSIDAKEAFLEGYGLHGRALKDAMPFVKALNILHYTPVVQKAMKQGDRKRLEQLHARVSGTLDLYTPAP